MPFTISTINRTSKPGNYSVGNNLYVHIKSNTRKYWYFRFQNNGERRYLYLGSLNKLNKDQAKLAANEIHLDLGRKREQNRLATFAAILGAAIPTPQSGSTYLRDDTSPLYKDAIVSFMEIKSADLGEKKQLSWVNGHNCPHE